MITNLKASPLANRPGIRWLALVILVLATTLTLFELGKERSLEDLSLAWNIPYSILRLAPNVEVLALPQSVDSTRFLKDYSNLRALSLAHNVRVPNIGRLPMRLEVLDVSYSRISQISLAMRRLTALDITQSCIQDPDLSQSDIQYLAFDSAQFTNPAYLPKGLLGAFITFSSTYSHLASRCPDRIDKEVFQFDWLPAGLTMLSTEGPLLPRHGRLPQNLTSLSLYYSGYDFNPNQLPYIQSLTIYCSNNLSCRNFQAQLPHLTGLTALVVEPTDETMLRASDLPRRLSVLRVYRGSFTFSSTQPSTTRQVLASLEDLSLPPIVLNAAGSQKSPLRSTLESQLPLLEHLTGSIQYLSVANPSLRDLRSGVATLATNPSESATRTVGLRLKDCHDSALKHHFPGFLRALAIEGCTDPQTFQLPLSLRYLNAPFELLDLATTPNRAYASSHFGNIQEMASSQLRVLVVELPSDTPNLQPLPLPSRRTLLRPSREPLQQVEAFLASDLQHLRVLIIRAPPYKGTVSPFWDHNISILDSTYRQFHR